MLSCHRKLKIFAGNSNPGLCDEIAAILDTSLVKASVGRFSDGEIRVQIHESIRGADVFVIQSLCRPVHENIMELLIVIDALKRASARSITAVLPYYAYARQDRKSLPREPIAAKMLANLIAAAGATRVLAIDLHAPQIQGFFDIPVDHLKAAPILSRHLEERGLTGCVIVSPDVGGVARARVLAEHLGATLAIVDKRRPKPNISEVMNIIGDVAGKPCVLVDDLVDTAGTIVQAAQALLDRGATSVRACCTHGVLSGPALDRLKASRIEELVITNTIPVTAHDTYDRITVLSVAPLFAEAIRRIYEELSVSILFD
ncbi:MAG: Ribose-phosphate pyrophosphokinase [Firmicutes bacterium ADurb.Bin506]|jgi:ribose-phosphate pyrophosphokinase|nr:MAG: Ribose-phosphate pyrophosphokinase [Firmicutes bacterium ADurb.Bin506]